MNKYFFLLYIIIKMLTRNLRRVFLNFTPIAPYHENVIDHYEKPRNVGSMDKMSKYVGTGLVGAPACGDVMKLQIMVGEDG